MRLELIVGETLDRVLGDVQPPRIDPAEVRRAARAPRRARFIVLVALVLVVMAVGTSLLWSEDPPEQRAVDPGLPAMDFGPGLRGYLQSTGRIHLGGQTISGVRDLDASASVTPHGLVYFSTEQAVRLLTMSGDVQTLAAAPADPDAFTPSVRFDIYSPRVAWATRSGDEVTVSVYEFGEDPGLVGRYPVPCEGVGCDAVEVVGYDVGMVYVYRPGASMVLNPADGEQARWTTLTSRRMVDVRSKQLLTVGGDPAAPVPPPLDATWIFAPAASEESRLSFDGTRQLDGGDGSTTLDPVRPGVWPLELQLPPGAGATDVAFDSDSTVLVSRRESDGYVLWDCDLNGLCFEIDRMPPAEGPPVFMG